MTRRNGLIAFWLSVFFLCSLGAFRAGQATPTPHTAWRAPALSPQEQPSGTAALTRPQYNIRDLGAIYFTGSYPGSSQGFDINDSDQVVGTSGTISGSDAFLWDPAKGLFDLGTLGGYSYSYTAGNGQTPFRRSVNSAGQVAGYSYEYGPLGSADVTTSSIRHAFRWDGTFGMQDLGALFTDKNGYSDSLAYGISDLGYVVGDSTSSNGYTRGFLWMPSAVGPGGLIADLGSLAAPGSSYATYPTHAAGINGSGEVTGYAYASDGTYHAFLYSGGQMYDIGPAGKYSQGYAINDAGQVAGLLSSTNDGFLWTPTAPNGVTGASVDIGAITPVALNARGQIAGNSSLPGVNQYVGSTFPHATLWTPNADPTTGGTATDLGLLQSTSGYGSSQALALSGNGQVVGYASNSHAFVYRDGLMYDLNDLLTGSGKNGWTLTSANAISTQGDITGYGYLNGYTHAFLLTAASPAAAPAPTISALSPNQAIATHPAFTLEVAGAGFALGSVVHWKNDAAGSADVPLPSTVESDGLIRAAVAASLIAAPGTATVTVTNTDGQTSGPQTFTILAPNPAPTITAITPPSAPAGSPATKVVITGTNFLSKALGDSFDSTVSFYSDYYSTFISATGTSAGAGVTIVSHTEIDVTVPAADMVDGSLVTVTVSNPAPDGGSATGKFSVVNPTPVITGLAPPSVGQNSPTFTLTVQGTGFEPSSVVYWQGPKGDTYGGNFYYLGGTWDPAKPGQVTVSVDARYLTTAGTAQIKVTNNTSGGGGGDSAPASYTVTASGNPVPTVDHIKPIGFGYHWPLYYYPYGTYPLTISSKASDYVSGASVFFGPDQVASVTVASDHTSITANLSDALIAKYAPGTVVKIKVHNPAVSAGGTDGGDSGTADFTVGNPRPEVTSQAPAGIPTGSAATSVTLTGTGFIAGTTGTTQVVVYSPSGAATTLTPTVGAGGTQLTVTVPAAALTAAGSLSFRLTNAPILANDSNYGALDGGVTSFAMPVTVPAATLTAISPVAGIAKTAQQLTLTGTGFLAGVSTVYFSPPGSGAYSYTPDSVSADGTTLTVTIPAGTVTPVGDAQVAVYQNATVAPAGAANPTAALPFTIQAAPNPKPTNVTLSPATVEAGHDGFTMTVSASGLAYNASSPPYVSWDGGALKTASYNRSGSTLTSLTVQVPPSLVASVGTHQVTVTNPPPYVTAGVPASSTSDPVPFVVTAGPQITTLSPAQAAAGGPGFTLDIQGTGFENGVSVFWNGGFRATTYYSDTHIAAAIAASDIAAVGAFTVQAVNPPPGGGKSNLVSFAVVAPNPAPTLTGLSPASTVAGAASFTLTLTGTGFLSSSTVQFGGDTLAPTGTATSTQMAVTVPAADVAQPGQVTVTVTDPAPGGGQSGPQTFTVTTPAGPPPPTAPTLLNATAVSSSEIDLAWSPGTSAVGSALPAGGGGGAPIGVAGGAASAVTYNVKRSLTPGGPYQTIPPATSALSDADTGLQPSTTYYYVVSEVSGGQESPNSNEKSATTPAAPQANLAPTSLTFPASLAGGQSTSVSWTVQDTGLADASGSWSDTLYLSTSTTVDGSAVSLGTFAAPTSLKAGASYTQTQSVTLPTVSAGTYYLIVVADSAKSVPETTYGDNALAVAAPLLHTEGLVVTPDQGALSVTPGIPAQGQLTLTNLSGTALTGLTVTPQGAAPSITVSLSPPTSLDPHAAQTVTYTVSAADLSALSSTVTLDFKTAGGDDAQATLSVTVLAPQPNLVAKPTTISTGMVRGQTSLVELDVTNTGTQAAKGLKVSVPQAPWLALATPALIGDLAPGATTKVLLNLMPSATLPLGIYSGSVTVYGSNAQVKVPASFNCTSSAKGDLTVTAQDEYTFFADGHPGVSGATVTLTNPQTGVVVLTGVTDGTGTFVAHGVTQASYNVTVSAPKHRTYHNGLILTPGINNPVQAYLPIQLVSYTFSVVPVNTPAQYQVTLDATFETHVPAPVITVSPALLDLNQVTFDKNGQAVVNYTFTNHGLIAANNTTVQFPDNPAYTITPAVPNIGTLAAGETVVVPVQFSRKAAAGAVRPSDLVCGTVTAHVFWEFVCGGVREDSGDMYISYGSCISTGAPYTDLQTTLAQIELDPQPHNFPLPFGPVQPDDPLYGPPTVVQDTPCQLNVSVGAAKPALKPADAPPSGICARVKLQFDQDVALTRTAFRATLDLLNDPQNVPLQNVQISLSVLDANQQPTKDLFAISAPTLSGVDAVDGTGTVAPGGDGNVQWTLIPTHGAAPSVPTQYYVGGTISYLQDGVQFTVPIFPTPILVKPDPSLQLHYFLERNVYGPDPRAPDLAVLPEPFSLGLLVVNAGGGTAHAMTIATAQPQLVDNQKGLAITFNLIGSQVNGQAITPSFQTSLGDIEPGGTATADWLLTSSLPGQFLSFDASFNDLNDLGNPQTSLIDSVDAHALIHVVRADFPSDDGKPDFLTEEQLNADDLPDTVWLSDGTTATVTAVTGATASGPPPAAGGTVQVTLPAPPAGYTFVQLDDPAPGQFPTRVVRADGRALRLSDNVWTTSRVVALKGQTPYIQDRLYLFDVDPSATYTLTYAPVGGGTGGGTGGGGTGGGGTGGGGNSQTANGLPAIGALSPSSAPAGTNGLSLTVSGVNFVSGSAVVWNGMILSTSFQSSATLVAAVTPADLADPGTAVVSVLNPDGSMAAPLGFNIGQMAAAGPAPPATKSPVALVGVTGVARAGGQITLTASLYNGSGATSAGVTLTGATLGGAGAVSVPTVGDLPAGGFASVPLTFPDAGAPSGTLVFLQLKGAFSGGQFNTSLRVPLP